MHTTCIGLHVVQRSAVSADIAICLIVETPPVSVRNITNVLLLYISRLPLFAVGICMIVYIYVY